MRNLVIPLGLLLVGVAVFLVRAGGNSPTGSPATQPSAREIPPEIAKKLVPDGQNKVHLTDEEWKQILTDEQFYVLRKEGTERPFKNAYVDNHSAGKYLCAGCGQELFDSDQKFDSGTGWPSFWQPILKTAIDEKSDNDPVSPRVEVECSRCGGHQGHVFTDGPKPTGLRYCINSAAIRFVAR